MSLGRALTTRLRSRFEDGAGQVPNRAFSTKRPVDKPFDRKLISLPVELISCSNNLAYEAPDIGKITANIAPEEQMCSPTSPTSLPTASEAAARTSSPTESQQQHRLPHPQPSHENMLSPLSSASSTRSWDDSLASPALTSASSVTSQEDSRECSPSTVEPNPMSSFFIEKDPSGASSKKSSIRETKTSFSSRQSTATNATTSTSVTSPDVTEEAVPEIPKRSLTHTKQTHQVLARHRSRSRLSGARESTDNASSLRGSSSDLPTPIEHNDNPFSAELEKVNELVEELCTGGKTADEPEVRIVDEETQYLIDNGFGRFTASDYIAEIQPLFFRAFGESARPMVAQWI